MATQQEMKDIITTAKEHIGKLEAEIERLMSPPLSMTTMIRVLDPATHRIMVASGGGQVIVDAPPDWDLSTLRSGQMLIINGMGAVVDRIDTEIAGGEAVVKRCFDGEMMEVEGGLGGGVALIFKGNIAACVKPGDTVQLDRSGSVALKIIPKDRSAHSVETATGVTWDDIGGQDEAKAILREAIEGPIKQAKLFKAYGKKGTKGVLMSGPPGCVDGNAVITLNRAGKGYTTTLRDLYEKFNDIPHVSSNNRKYHWDLSIPTMIRCLHDGELRLKQVVGVYDKGVKAVKRLVLADGKELFLTPDHEVKTAAGFKRIDALAVGELVYTNGFYINTSNGYEYQCSGLKNHPRARRTTKGGYELSRHILVAEATLNGLTFDEWMEKVSRDDLVDAKFVESTKHVHHLDENRVNNSPENLQVLTRTEHAQVHKFRLHLPRFIPNESAVTCVEDAGTIHVYDVTVDEAHNFVANGIVVHNCGKTLLAKAVANAVREMFGGASDSGFIYIKGPEVLNMWVGNTESQIRGLFVRAKEHKEEHGYPAVVFIDEADAILGKRGGHHASVLSSTIVPTFLAEMDGLSDSGAFVLLATNRQDILDPAIVREGRIDRKVVVARPDLKASAQILRIHLNRTKLADDPDELAGTAAAEMFNDIHHLYNVGLKAKGVRKFYIRHLVSGAMLAGTVDVATSFAINRDVEAGHQRASGLRKTDMIEAVRQIVKANRNLNHEDDLLHFAEQHGSEIEAVQRIVA